MASKNTKPRAQTYSLLTNVQKNILKRHFDNEMVGIGRQYQEMVTRAAEETNLSRDNNNNNNNNSFINLLKKAFQLNLQFKYLKITFPKIPLKNAV